MPWKLKIHLPLLSFQGPSGVGARALGPSRDADLSSHPPVRSLTIKLRLL